MVQESRSCEHSLAEDTSIRRFTGRKKVDQSTLAGYFVLIATVTAVPGPLIAVATARSLNRDNRGAISFAAGVCLGDMIAIIAIAVGIGTWVEGQPQLLSLVRYAGVGYLLWVAARIWIDSGSSTCSMDRQPRTGVLLSAVAGIALCLGNPATILFHMLLLPSVAPAGSADIARLVAVIVVAFVAVGLVFACVILLSSRASRLLCSPSSSALFSRSLSAIIAATSFWLLAV